MMNSRFQDSLFAILSGVMLTASFPPGNTAWMAWVALIPLLRAISGKSRRTAFTLGFTAGVAHYATLVYWIMVVLGHYGGLPWFISLGVLGLFCVYLSLYPAVFAFCARVLQGSRMRALSLGTVWVGLEFVRAKALSGFPWCLLGHTQYQSLHLIQTADLAGVYGLSFLLVAVNTLMDHLFFDLQSFRQRWRKMEGVLVAFLLITNLAYGIQRLQEFTEKRSLHRPFLRLAIVQGNIDQSVKWSPVYQEKTVSIYEELTLSARPFKPDLVLWPETAVPFFFQDHSPLAQQVIDLARSLQTVLLFGSPAYHSGPEGERFYNRAYMLSPEGLVTGSYDKNHLVPFGEYVPLKRFLPFVRRLVPAAGDFVAGSEPTPLSIPTLSVGVLICFEVIFPELAGAQVRSGAHLLTNLTNDAWFGMTSAPHQHLSMAAFRAVETRRPLIRAANTGISAVILPSGEIALHGGLFQREVLTERVAPEGSAITFYTAHGDLFAGILLILSLIQIFFSLCYKRTSFPKSPSGTGEVRPPSYPHGVGKQVRQKEGKK